MQQVRETLLGALTTLAGDDLSHARRSAACRFLLDDLERWGRGYLNNRFGASLGDETMDDAIQHVMMQAALGSARFRGTSEGEARKWCRTLLHRFAIDELRRGRRIDRSDSDRLERQRDVPGHTAAMPAPDEGDTFRCVCLILEHIRAEIVEGRRGEAAETISRSFECHLACRKGDTLEEQLRTWAGFEGGEAESNEFKRARDRVYQYRKRGRVAGCRALSVLAEGSKFIEEEIALMRRVLDCRPKE